MVQVAPRETDFDQSTIHRPARQKACQIYQMHSLNCSYLIETCGGPAKCRHVYHLASCIIAWALIAKMYSSRDHKLLASIRL
jgi:hypothetical protein